MYQTGISPTGHLGHSPTPWDPSWSSSPHLHRGAAAFPLPQASFQLQDKCFTWFWVMESVFSLPHGIVLIKALSAWDTDLHPGFLEADNFFLQCVHCCPKLGSDSHISWKQRSRQILVAGMGEDALSRAPPAFVKEMSEAALSSRELLWTWGPLKSFKIF